MIPDISEIGEIAYSWDFDQDEYEEYLQDNGLEKNQDTLLEYISNYVAFEMEFYDNQYYHCFATDSLTLDEISNEFGDKLVNRILSDCSEKNCGSCETCEIMDDEGIKPMGKNFYNENKKKTKNLIIDENDETKIIKHILNEVFYPTTEKVLLITNYLDKNFAKQSLDSLDDNGYPTKENTVVLLSNEKQPLKTLNMKELLRLLDDKFEKIMSKKEDRRKFLKQVIKDWYFNNIKNGILTVNFIK